MMFSKIKKRAEEGVTILSPRGEFTGGPETDELRNALASEAESGATKLLVDLGDVTYLNSTALGVLIAAHTSIVKRGGIMGLCNVSKNIENLFVITKLVLVFKVFESVEEGISAVTSEA